MKQAEIMRDTEIIIYHGSQEIVKEPKFGVGKTYNDFGQGFYCTEGIELAREWACPIQNDGYTNKYCLNLDGLTVLDLTKDEFDTFYWLAILLRNRKFDIIYPICYEAREYILSNYSLDTSDIDVMIGYRADDSHFSFVNDFISNSSSLSDLNTAIKLDESCKQVVLLSERSFSQIKFLGYETVDYREYYRERVERDIKLRTGYVRRLEKFCQTKDEVFILDFVRGEVKGNDTRLQSAIS